MRNDMTVSILTAEQIMFFRPVGQSVFIANGDEANPKISVPIADGLAEDPIVALFDGLPQENHPFLANRLIIDDPDDYSPQYQVADRKHGTSMASLIALGDLPSGSQNSHRIYVRPIMKPKQALNETIEEVPDDILLVDKIYEAVRRLFAKEAGAVAPTVKVINLSIGIGNRQFDRSMSPLARLLDWLSFKYRVLFVVSAGNITGYLNDWNIGVPFKEFATLNIAERDKIVIKWINSNSRNMRLLSPAESLNALTVGATFSDASSFTETNTQKLPCSQKMVSPISALGKGLNNSIKPDIVYHGGRCVITERVVTDNFLPPDSLQWLWRMVTREPGTQSAAPTTPGAPIKTVFSFGTSNAAALISHEASKCYDALIDVFANADLNLPDEHVAPLIKAMLVHGSEWGALKDFLSQSLGLLNRKQYPDALHRFIGYGEPNIDRAIECAKKRITLLGFGSLNNDEAHLYNLPLPFDFNKERITRRLTVTLTYFTPITPSRQDYRSAQVWFVKENDKPEFLESRVDASDTAVTRGTTQHEIFENDAIVAWSEGDALQLKVNCRAVASKKLADAIPYALLVSFEIKSDIDVDVYTKISDLVTPKITVR